MKYKVGDKVKVRNNLEIGKYYGRGFFTSFMNGCKGKVLTIAYSTDIAYYVQENTFAFTEEMLEPNSELFESENEVELSVQEEMSAEEAIKLFAEMCDSYSLCEACAIHENKGEMRCNQFKKLHPEKVLEVLKQWKSKHEKKPIETEFINVVRVIENTGVMKKCVYEERLPKGELNLSDKQVEILRKYCEEHKGKYFAVVERICAVKE